MAANLIFKIKGTCKVDKSEPSKHRTLAILDKSIIKSFPPIHIPQHKFTLCYLKKIYRENLTFEFCRFNHFFHTGISRDKQPLYIFDHDWNSNNPIPIIIFLKVSRK